MTLGNDGNLYGTAYAGGGGPGSVFTVNPATRAFATLIWFGGAIGAYPSVGLALANDGKFYGSTTASGGTLFQLDPAGTLTTLYSFTNSDAGSGPEGLLLQTSDGSFYGTTSAGGAHGGGTVFKFTTNGGLATLYSFGAVTNWDGSALDGGDSLAGLVTGPDGDLYGTTYSGGYNNSGTVFKITTNGTLTTLAWLDGSTGSHPVARLALGTDGNFYGTTEYGGANGFGTIFQLVIPPSAPWIQAVSAAGGMINLAWSATAGQTYQVQYRADLSQGNWVNLGCPIVATAAQLNVTDDLTHSQRFYRVLRLQGP